MSRLLSIDEAREALGNMGRTTLHGHMRKGEIAFVKIGKRTLIPQDAVDEFIAARRVEATAQPIRPEKCPACGRWFKASGMAIHVARKHGGAA